MISGNTIDIPVNNYFTGFSQMVLLGLGRMKEQFLDFGASEKRFFLVGREWFQFSEDLCVFFC